MHRGSKCGLFICDLPNICATPLNVPSLFPPQTWPALQQNRRGKHVKATLQKTRSKQRGKTHAYNPTNYRVSFTHLCLWRVSCVWGLTIGTRLWTTYIRIKKQGNWQTGGQSKKGHGTDRTKIMLWGRQCLGVVYMVREMEFSFKVIYIWRSCLWNQWQNVHAEKKLWAEKEENERKISTIFCSTLLFR